MSNLETLAITLEGSNDYRVLRRFRSEDVFGELKDGCIKSLCIIDFETTGLEDTDKPIEIGILRVEYDAKSGRLGRVLERYSGFNDPGEPLPENIVALTGITDDQVRGQKFDRKRVKEIATSSSLIIAHNAEFDRRFGEKHFPFLADLTWACSLHDVPWNAAGGIGSGKLEFIALKLGWFYDAHRAIADCEVTAGVLGRELNDGQTGLWHLLQTARRPRYRVWALDASFKAKSVLKSHGYTWRDIPESTKKAWHIETATPNIECDFLKETVLNPGDPVLVEEVGFANRFTARRAKAEYVTL